MSGFMKIVRARLTVAAVAVLSVGGFLASTAAPSSAVSGGTCPVAYDQSIFVSIPLPAHSNGTIQGQIGIDCSGYTQMQVAPPAHGKITWSGALNQDYSYSPKPGYFGEDGAQYCLTLVSAPGSCSSQVATLSFFMGHANNDTYVTPAGTPLLVGCTGCLSDPHTNDEPVWYALDNVNTLPKHGTLTWQMGSWSQASFGYVPKPGFVGTDSFTYCMSFHGEDTGCPATFSTSSNGVSGIIDSASSNIATVTIKVIPKQPLVQLLVPPISFSLAPKALLYWTGEDYTGGPGLAYFQVRTRHARWNGVFGPWTLGPHLPLIPPFATPGLPAGFDSCFQVRAVEKGGRASAWTAPYCVARPLDDASLAASGGWTRKKNSQYYLGTVTVTTKHGAKLTLAGAKLDRLAVVATQCAGCGQIGVYAGTKLIAKINLAGAGIVRQKVFVLPAFKLASAKVSIVVLSSGKTVEIDGLGVSRT